MVPRSLVILGSTGSIGNSTLDVLRRHPGNFVVRALAANRSTEQLITQYEEFEPAYLWMGDPGEYAKLRERLTGRKVTVLTGEEDLLKLTELEDVDLVVNAIVGAAGLRASLRTIEAGKTLALANKESLVAGGPLFGPIQVRTNARVLPIDSEHSAVWQCMCAGKLSEVRKVILTASGGPFRDLPKEEFEKITLEQALTHPTWAMGPKITVDSATLVNKGLEVIEAVALFGVSVDKVNVLIHRQSIVHSMVEYVDSAVLAQLSLPDMRLPISYALFWPERVQSEFGAVNWRHMKELTFDIPDYERFPLLKLAFQVAEAGETAPAVFNAANEVAVQAFLNRGIRFVEIADIVTQTVDRVKPEKATDLETILTADRMARETARSILERVSC